MGGRGGGVEGVVMKRRKEKEREGEEEQTNKQTNRQTDRKINMLINVVCCCDGMHWLGVGADHRLRHWARSQTSILPIP